MSEQNEEIELGDKSNLLQGTSTSSSSRISLTNRDKTDKNGPNLPNWILNENNTNSKNIKRIVLMLIIFSIILFGALGASGLDRMTSINSKLSKILTEIEENNNENVSNLTNFYKTFLMEKKCYKSFLNICINLTNLNEMYLEISSNFLSLNDEIYGHKVQVNPHLFLISAIYGKGTYLHEDLQSLLYMPAEDTEENVFAFILAPGGGSIDLVRVNLGIRTSDDGYDSVLDQGAVWSGYVASLDIVAVDYDVDGVTPLSYIVDAAQLLENGYYITAVDTLLVEELRIDSDTIHNFTSNFDLLMEYQYYDSSLQESVPLAYHFSFVLLPEDQIMARYADERVGYFTTGYKDMGDHRDVSSVSKHDSDKVDTQIYIINRRRISDEHPLIYYIDPSVPVEWREAVAKGVELWQPAFEELGYDANVVRAVLPDDNDWPSDYNVGDIRFNTISWALDFDETFAIGPSIVDPRSGEILCAHIVMTHGWVSAYIKYMEKLNPTIVNRQLKNNLKRKLKLNADIKENNNVNKFHDMNQFQLKDTFLYNNKQMPDYLNNIKSNSKIRNSFRHREIGVGEQLDKLGFQFVQLSLAASATDGDVPDWIIEQSLTGVIAHEVGHCHGLRHNFMGSIGMTYEQLQDKSFTQENGLSTSVMDYLGINLPENITASPESIDYFSPVIGEYDKWAISYGYVEVTDEINGQPAPELENIASETKDFASDEDEPGTEGVLPLVNTYDLSSDPILFHQKRLDLVEYIRPLMLDRMVYTGERYTRYLGAETTMLSTIERAGYYLTKFIGGVHVDRRRKEDSVEIFPITASSGQEQRRALVQILRILIETDDAGAIAGGNTLFPQANLWSFLAEETGVCSGIQSYCFGVEPYDILGTVDDMKSGLLEHLLEEDRLNRLRTTEWATEGVDAEYFSVNEFFGNVTESMFGTNFTRSDNKRNWPIQSSLIDNYSTLADSSSLSQEVRAVVTFQLLNLAEELNAFLTELPKYDSKYSHLVSLLRRIELWELGDP